MTKSHGNLLRVVAAGCLLLAAACDGESAEARELRRALDEAGRGLTDAAAALRDYAYAQRDELTARLEGDLQAMERRLADYRERAAELSGDAAAAAREHARQLTQQLQAARARMDALADSGQQAWVAARDGAVEAWSTLNASMDEAAAELSDVSAKDASGDGR